MAGHHRLMGALVLCSMDSEMLPALFCAISKHFSNHQCVQTWKERFTIALRDKSSDSLRFFIESDNPHNMKWLRLKVLPNLRSQRWWIDSRREVKTPWSAFVPCSFVILHIVYIQIKNQFGSISSFFGTFEQFSGSMTETTGRWWFHCILWTTWLISSCLQFKAGKKEMVWQIFSR